MPDEDLRPEIKTVIVKPTNECNLACKYCYAGSEPPSGKMSVETLEALMTTMPRISSSKAIEFIWHGGEPLLMGKDFFEKIVEIEKETFPKEYTISNAIQTNATLITEDFMEFFAENHFEVGSSLDGPREVHDAQRVFENDKGSFDRVIAGLEIIKKFQPGAGVISIITKNSLLYAKEMYHFFKDRHLEFKTNPLIPTGRYLKNRAALAVSSAEYATFMCELFDEWFYDPAPTISATSLSDRVREILSDRHNNCWSSESCQNSFIAVDAKGDIFPCGRFYEAEFNYGNIRELNLSRIGVREKLLERGCKLPPSCKKCDIVQICNSGCMHNAYVNGDIMQKDVYCKAYKTITNHLRNAIEQEFIKAEVHNG